MSEAEGHRPGASGLWMGRFLQEGALPLVSEDGRQKVSRE